MTRRNLLLHLLLASITLRVAAAPADLLLVAPDDTTLAPLLEKLEEPRRETRAAWTFWSGQLLGKSVVLTRTEGDPLNAVAATTLAVRRYEPRLIVVFGLGRAHDPALRPHDVVVSESFVAFDGIVSPAAGIGDGSDALKWKKLPHPLMTHGERETPTSSFPASATALAVAKSLSPAPGRIVVGTLGSANQINREADRIAWLRAQWGTTCEDGESAHVAGVGQLLGTPVIGFRVIDGSPIEAAAFTLKFVEAWK
ncbi:MAG: 5'-methylthioadenosine/S-adenosylhomocysteine nucleosidase [Opitutaceae bacterium]